MSCIEVAVAEELGLAEQGQVRRRGGGRRCECGAACSRRLRSQPLAQPDPAVATVASAGGYLAVRLTRQRTDSAASDQGMWPIDPSCRDWSADPAAFAAAGMPRALLPHLVDPGALLGHVTDTAAAATGLPEGCPVFATANDMAVEALGCGLAGDRTVLLSLGTYIAAMTLGTGIAAPDDRYWVNSAAIPGRFLYESGGIRRGMWTVTWPRQLVCSAVQGPIDEAAMTAMVRPDRAFEPEPGARAACDRVMRGLRGAAGDRPDVPAVRRAARLRRPTAWTRSGAGIEATGRWRVTSARPAVWSSTAPV